MKVIFKTKGSQALFRLMPLENMPLDAKPMQDFVLWMIQRRPVKVTVEMIE